MTRTTAACCLGLVLAGCPDSDGAPNERPAEHRSQPQLGEHKSASEKAVEIDPGMLRDLRITTAPAESRPVGDTVAVLGELRVNEDAYAEVGSSVPARVARVLAAPGDEVRAGQPLAELESVEVGRARAALDTANVKVALADQTVRRRRDLAGDRIVSQRDLQASEAELAASRADLAAAQHTLSAFGAGHGDGARFTLSAPIAGTVIDRKALRGQLVDAEHALFVVSDLRRLWLVVHAFERDALRMRSGASARVTFPALPGQLFSGDVMRLGQRVDPTSRTVDVRIDIDNPSGVLRPGMSASANVPIGDATETIVAVPIQAIQRHPRGWCVFIPEASEGHFGIREVGRGRDLGDEVEILSGLRAGERVVVDGAFLLKAEADKAHGGGEHHH